MTMYGIIYKVVNSANGKVYIGLTTSDLEIRKYQHKNKSEKQKNKQLLYKAIRKYGWANFEWEIIDHAENEHELNEKEVTWIKFYNSYAFKENSNGYNMTIGGESTKGLIVSQETRKKISLATKGENNPNFGKIATKETRDKIRESRLGKTSTLETKQKMSDARKGSGNAMFKKNHSEESRLKISNSHKGKVVSIETKLKISEATKGRKLSDEHKNKIGESKKGKSRKLGESHGRSKLTENDVRQARELHSTGWYSYSFLAKVFNVNETAISRAIKRETWNYID